VDISLKLKIFLKNITSCFWVLTVFRGSLFDINDNIPHRPHIDNSIEKSRLGSLLLIISNKQ